MARIDEIKARLEATNAPWESWGEVHEDRMIPIVLKNTDRPVAYVGVKGFPNVENAAFIAAAPDDMRLLIDTLEALARSYPSDVPPDDAEAYFAAKKGLQDLGIWFTDAELAEQAGVTVEEYQASLYD